MEEPEQEPVKGGARLGSRRHYSASAQEPRPSYRRREDYQDHFEYVCSFCKVGRATFWWLHFVCNSFDFTSSGHSTRGGAVTRWDPVHPHCFPHPLTGLLLLYYLLHLLEAPLLSYPHLLLWVHGLVLKQAAIRYLLQTLPSCHAIPSEKSLHTHAAKNTELLRNATWIIQTRTECKHCVLVSFSRVHINRGVTD